MKTEKPNLLTYTSSDGEIYRQAYVHDMLIYLEAQEEEWEDWPCDFDVPQ